MKNLGLNLVLAIVLLVVALVVLEDCHRQRDCENNGGVYVSSHWHTFGRCVHPADAP